MRVPKQHYKALCQLFASVESTKEAGSLLEDILTPQELESLAERWQIVQEIAKGIPQRDIAKKLNVSVSKVTRGSRVMKYGNGSLDRFIQRINK